MKNESKNQAENINTDDEKLLLSSKYTQFYLLKYLID
jgi:hypothetical protein